MTAHLVWFAPQYGVPGSWRTCTVDQHGVWRAPTGTYMPTPNAHQVKPAAQHQPAPVSILPPRKTANDYPGYIESFRVEAAALYNSALDDVAKRMGVRP